MQRKLDIFTAVRLDWLQGSEAFAAEHYSCTHLMDLSVNHTLLLKRMRAQLAPPLLAVRVDGSSASCITALATVL